MSGEQPAARVVATLDRLGRPDLWTARRGLFGERRRGLGRRFEHLWPFANAWAAVAAAATVPGAQEAHLARRAQLLLEGFPRGLGAYASAGPGWASAVGPPLGPGGDRYFDDNAWLGLAMVRHHERSGDATVLEQARRAFTFVASGWSEAPGALPGGVRWRDTLDSLSRHACSTAPAVELAVLLAERSGERRLLQWAVTAYRWLREALQLPDALYADRVAPDGAREETRWSYNQGAAVGAGVLLHRATGDDCYLADAVATARAALERYTDAALVGQGTAFNAVYFRNLLLLGATGQGEGASLAAQARAQLGRYLEGSLPDPATGRPGVTVLHRTAPLLELQALAAGAPPAP